MLMQKYGLNGLSSPMVNKNLLTALCLKKNPVKFQNVMKTEREREREIKSKVREHFVCL